MGLGVLTYFQTNPYPKVGSQVVRSAAFGMRLQWQWRPTGPLRSLEVRKISHGSGYYYMEKNVWLLLYGENYYYTIVMMYGENNHKTRIMDVLGG